VIDIKDNGVVDARELHQLLKIKTKFNDWIVRKKSIFNSIEDIDYIESKKHPITKQGGGRPYKVFDLTLKFAALICLSESTHESIKIYQYLDEKNPDSVFFIKPERDEIFFGIKLFNFIGHITDIKQQYPVSGFRLDFYLPEFNIAIEYDEKHHERQIESDIDRQIKIEDLLYCDFVRVNHDNEISGVKNIVALIISKLKSRRVLLKLNEDTLFDKKEDISIDSVKMLIKND
jgi:phage anti-repressor protein/very-short-patch-repair endonuclease